MKPTPKDKLILDMLAAIESLGWDCGRMARVAARDCYRYYKRRAARMGLKPEKS